MNTIINPNEELKDVLDKTGREYAQTCSWEHISEQRVKSKTNHHNNAKKNIAIFNSFASHYEMFGYIIDYCKANHHKLTIFTQCDNNLGWLQFYKNIFSYYNFEYKNISDYEVLKDTFDIVFVTTDDDYSFKQECISDKCITIDHTCFNRRPEFKHHLEIRQFNVDRPWVLPCFNIFNKNDKLNMPEPEINIAIIGGNNDYNYEIINRLNGKVNINLFILARHALKFDRLKIKKESINVKIFNNIDTNELCDILKKCDYIFTDVTYNTDHINGVSMSGSVPLSFSTLTALIISKTNNAMYKFKNVVEFDLDSTAEIMIDKGVVNIDLLIDERDYLMSMLDKYIVSNKF